MIQWIRRLFFFSYLAADASGKASAPSSFLSALLAPMGGMDGLREAGRLHVVPAGQLVFETRSFPQHRITGIACVPMKAIKNINTALRGGSP